MDTNTVFLEKCHNIIDDNIYEIIYGENGISSLYTNIEIDQKSIFNIVDKLKNQYGNNIAHCLIRYFGMILNDVESNIIQLSTGHLALIININQTYKRAKTHFDETTGEHLCIVFEDSQLLKIGIYMLNVSPVILFALNKFDLLHRKDIKYIKLTNIDATTISKGCTYSNIRSVIRKVIKLYWFGDTDIYSPYGSLKESLSSCCHRCGDSYGTDALRYNLFKVFLHPSKNNKFIAALLMKDQQWCLIYPKADEIYYNIRNCFHIEDNCIVENEEVLNSYFGEVATSIIKEICTVINNFIGRYKLKSNDIELLFESFYFWEYFNKEALSNLYYTYELRRDDGIKVVTFILPTEYQNLNSLADDMFVTLNAKNDIQRDLLRYSLVCVPREISTVECELI